MKKLILFASLLGVSLGLSAAISEFPYSAAWTHLSTTGEDGTTSYGGNTGVAGDDKAQYDLGGWELSPTDNAATTRPFFIPFTSGAPIQNALTFRFAATEAEKDWVSYVISPEFDFSNTGMQTITFKYGKSQEGATYYNLDVIYTTDYTGDPATTQWTVLQAAVIPAEQKGTGTSALATDTISASMTGSNVRIAFRACHDASVESITVTGNTNLQISNFAISASYALPYEASWQYKSEYINADDGATLAPPEGVDNSTMQADENYMDLGGWTSYKEKDSKIWGVTFSGSKQVVNTMEWTDNSKSSPGSVKTWFISPKISFAYASEKAITFKAGKEQATQLYSNISLYYSTDYNGDVSTATWKTIAKNIIEDSQVGIGSSNMQSCSYTLGEDFNNGQVTLAFVGDVYNENAYSLADPQTKQTKIRISEFKIEKDLVPNGINDIIYEAAESDEEPVYYNLQGVRIATPVQGIYVRVQGSKASKVLIR